MARTRFRDDAIARGAVSRHPLSCNGLHQSEPGPPRLHGSLANYFDTKAELFTAARTDTAVVSIDDEHGRRLAAQTEMSTRTCLTADPGAEVWASDITVPESCGARFVAHTTKGRVPVDLQVLGPHQVPNPLLALTTLVSDGFDSDAVAHGLALFSHAEREWVGMVLAAHTRPLGVAALHAADTVRVGVPPTSIERCSPGTPTGSAQRPIDRELHSRGGRRRDPRRRLDLNQAHFGIRRTVENPHYTTMIWTVIWQISSLWASN